MQEVDIHSAIELGSPYPYTLVITTDEEGKPNIMGLSWWTFTSLQPPMIAISVGHARYTHECLKGTSEFVICFPSKEQAEPSWLCGVKSGRKTDKLTETGFRTRPSTVVAPPILEGCTAAYECKALARMECGDHTLFNAEIVAVHADRSKAEHLYTVHYRKVVSIDSAGNVDFNLKYK